MFPWFRKKIKHNPMFDKHHDIIAIELTKPFRDKVAVLLSLNRLQLLSKLIETEEDMIKANKLSRTLRNKIKREGVIR